jgi:hypothetical protein
MRDTDTTLDVQATTAARRRPPRDTDCRQSGGGPNVHGDAGALFVERRRAAGRTAPTTLV